MIPVDHFLESRLLRSALEHCWSKSMSAAVFEELYRQRTMFCAKSSKGSDTREDNILRRLTPEHTDKREQSLGKAGRGVWSRGEAVLLAILTRFPEDSWWGGAGDSHRSLAAGKVWLDMWACHSFIVKIVSTLRHHGISSVVTNLSFVAFVGPGVVNTLRYCYWNFSGLWMDPDDWFPQESGEWSKQRLLGACFSRLVSAWRAARPQCSIQESWRVLVCDTTQIIIHCVERQTWKWWENSEPQKIADSLRKL